MEKAASDESLNFEKSFEDLENIVGQLESDELGLEQALELFERGVKTYGLLQTQLKNAEQKVKVLGENLKD